MFVMSWEEICCHKTGDPGCCQAISHFHVVMMLQFTPTTLLWKLLETPSPSAKHTHMWSKYMQVESGLCRLCTALVKRTPVQMHYPGTLKVNHLLHPEMMMLYKRQQLVVLWTWRTKSTRTTKSNYCCYVWYPVISTYALKPKHRGKQSNSYKWLLRPFSQRILVSYLATYA